MTNQTGTEASTRPPNDTRIGGPSFPHEFVDGHPTTEAVVDGPN